GPAALGVRPPAFLVQGVVLALPAAAAVGVDRDAAPGVALIGQTQIALVLRESDRRAVAKLRIDVSRPQVGGLDDVDVAIEDLELAVGHDAPPVRRTLTPARLVVKDTGGCYLIFHDSRDRPGTIPRRTPGRARRHGGRARRRARGRRLLRRRQ